MVSKAESARNAGYWKPSSDYYLRPDGRYTWAKCKVCYLSERHAHRLTYHDVRLQWDRLDVLEDRLLCYAAYGGMQCTWCGETRIGALNMDHVNGGGSAHYRLPHADGGIGRLYHYLRDHNFPPDFRVLCVNCNIRARILLAAPMLSGHKASQRSRRDRRLEKQRVMDYLGGVCVCCGEDDLDVLTLQHPNNDGAAHRRMVTGASRGQGSYNFYRRLSPADLDKLDCYCFSCNTVARYETQPIWQWILTQPKRDLESLLSAIAAEKERIMRPLPKAQGELARERRKQRIFELRAAGWTHKQIAAEIGLHFNYICGILSGRVELVEYRPQHI